jgi:hypothetical protein
LGTDANGQPADVGTLTFSNRPTIIPIEPNGTVNLDVDDQNAFTLPFDSVIENVYICVGNLGTVTIPPDTTVYPFVQLFSALPESNNFIPLPLSKTVPTTGFSGTVLQSTMRAASTSQIGISLVAGMRLLIGGQIQVSGSGKLDQRQYFYFSGGIALRPA